MSKNTSFEAKFEQIKAEFSQIYEGNFELFSLSKNHFRTRAEFGIYHDDMGIHYASFDPLSKKKIKIEKADYADKKICELMPNLLKALNSSSNLKEKLFGVEFLATRLDLSVTLLYHKNVSLISEDLANLSKDLGLNLIARSRGVKLVFGRENLAQFLNVNEREIRYEFNNDCFIQPNTNINEMMINWTFQCLENTQDLLELYCGYGNFTLPLAVKFKQVLATELSKKNIEFALKNCELNGVSNINFVRLASEELVSAMQKQRQFFRLKNIDLDSFNFSHILLDPPRLGLEKSVLELAKNYENIIYISCNPATLKRDLDELVKTHKIAKFALFDQFVNTPHLECGVLLCKKVSPK